MKRWGAALACGLIMVFGATGVAHAAPAADPPECTTLEAGRFGALEPGQVNTVTVAPGGTGCTEVHLTEGNHFLQVRGAGVRHSGWLFRADGSRQCPAPAGVLWNCRVATEGDYQIRIDNPSATAPLTYRVAAIQQDPASCTTEISTAWDSPRTALPQSDELESHCVRFDATAGESILGFSATGIVWVRDLAGAAVCGWPVRYNPPCRIGATGQYLAMTIAPAGATEDEIQIRSLTAAAGCPPVTPGSADPLDGVRCRTLTVPAPGKYRITNVTETGGTRTLIALGGTESAGDSACQGAYWMPGGLCEFTQAGTYALVADGDTSGLREAVPYSVTVAAEDPYQCQAVGLQGVSAPTRTGSFSAAGEVHCYEFTGANATDVDVLLPPSATGSARPDVQFVASPKAGYSRALLTARAAGDYRFALQGRRIIAGCQPWTTDVTADFSPGQITRCFRFQAQSDADLTVALRKLTGPGTARAEVTFNNGFRTCPISTDPEFTCEVHTGDATTVVLVADPEQAQYRLTRSEA